MEAQALRKRGWTITAIANHLGRDRKTIRAYLRGERQAGVRRSNAPDPLQTFIPYLSRRFTDDPHVWASALYDEVKRLGYQLSYPSFVRQVRNAKLRPHNLASIGDGRGVWEIFLLFHTLRSCRRPCRQLSSACPALAVTTG